MECKRTGYWSGVFCYFEISAFHITHGIMEINSKLPTFGAHLVSGLALHMFAVAMETCLYHNVVLPGWLIQYGCYSLWLTKNYMSDFVQICGPYDDFVSYYIYSHIKLKYLPLSHSNDVVVQLWRRQCSIQSLSASISTWAELYLAVCSLVSVCVCNEGVLCYLYCYVHHTEVWRLGRLGTGDDTYIFNGLKLRRIL